MRCLTFSGVGGGVVNHPYFQQHFGMYNADGTKDTHKVNNISSNVVSVLQAGAFFGALGSVPVSRESLSNASSIRKVHSVSAKLGRRYTLLIYSLFFCIGAVRPFLVPSLFHL